MSREKAVDFWVTHNLFNYMNKTGRSFTSHEIEDFKHYFLLGPHPWLDGDDEELKIKRISRFQVESVESRQKKWISSSVKKGKNLKDKSGLDLVTSFEEYSWYKLLTEASFTREGILMRNCVKNMQPKRHNIYSLHLDEKPVVHLEIRYGQIVEIRASCNKSDLRSFKNPLLHFFKVMSKDRISDPHQHLTQFGLFFEHGQILPFIDEDLTWEKL